jgi:hypothetical protein
MLRLFVDGASRFWASSFVGPFGIRVKRKATQACNPLSLLRIERMTHFARSFQLFVGRLEAETGKIKLLRESINLVELGLAIYPNGLADFRICEGGTRPPA